MTITEQIEELEDLIKSNEATVRPLRKIESQLIEQIRGADQTQAYTNNRPDCYKLIHAYTTENTIADINIDSDTLIKYVQREIKIKTSHIEEAKDKILKITEILNN